jgi:hypothetical protein
MDLIGWLQHFVLWIESHPGVASWVQAFGSFVAIVAAFMIGNKQMALQVKQKKSEDNQKLQAIYAVVTNAYTTVGELQFVISNDISPAAFRSDWHSLHGPLIEASYESLRKIPTHEFGSYDLVYAFNGLLSAVTNIRGRVIIALGATAFYEQEMGYMFEEVKVQADMLEYHWKQFRSACSIT